MSFKKGPKPARPPPPKGGLTLGGMSFKKLEQEEDGEDLTISDKYASVVQQARSNSAAAKTESSAHDSDTNAGDEDRSSPLKKSMFEYKELLSGLKDKIHGKITKTIEDISGESSASASPDKEHPLSGPLSKSADKLLETLPQADSASKSSTLTRNSSTEPTSLASAGKSSSQAELLIKPVSATKLHACPEPATAKPAPASEPAGNTNPTEKSKQSKPTEEKGSSGSADKPPSNVVVQLSSIANGEKEGEDIIVFEKHFKEPLEDFTGNPTGLITSTTVRPRSKLQSLKKKGPKTSATVSMSGLMHTPEEEDKTGFQSKSGSKSGSGTSSHAQDGKDVKSSDSQGMLHRLTSQEGSLIPWHKLLTIVSCVFAYFIVPLPPFLSGLIIGSMITAFVWTVYMWLMQPPKPKETMVLTPIEDLPPMQIPEMKDPTLEDGTYKSWMNEIAHYNPGDYHINHTYSVFVTLEGSRLRLQRPKTPVPKRAMHDENIPTPHFIHQRHFELKGSRVFLQPPGLVKKRIWSKKYPICLALAQEGTKSKSIESSVDAVASGQSANGKSDMGFEIVSEEKCNSSVLFLFARTGKEKEEWFRRFEAATRDKPLGNHIMEMRRAIERKRQQQHKRAGSDGAIRHRHTSNDSQSSAAAEAMDTAEAEPSDPLLDFTQYMGHLMPAGAFGRLMSPAHSAKSDFKDGERTARLPFTGSIICDSQLYWLNALIGRCFFDFLRDAWWAERVKDKLQRKLSKIHVPYFIEELQVTAIDMGKEMPVIRRAANPYLDEKGFWVELDVSYGGSFQMTIETKMNLMKLKRTDTKLNTPAPSVASDSRSPVTDSEEEDSAESSTDEEEEAAASPEEREGGGSKKLLKYLDKLTQSKYFQQATEYKYIKRAMENVSNTPLQLAVQVKSLVGKLAINVPPPPSDRLWYGFRGTPRLWLSAKPQVGERVVTITHITDWIERKLELEFQRVFVMPNMDDIIVPILRSGEGSTAGTREGRSSFSSQ